jgi:predicted acyltransferase (DUF342 family)
VKLNDLNDESPIFEKQEYEWSVDEHTAIGTILGHVKANDRDANDTVRYEKFRKIKQIIIFLTTLFHGNITARVSIYLSLIHRN